MSHSPSSIWTQTCNMTNYCKPKNGFLRVAWNIMIFVTWIERNSRIYRHKEGTFNAGSGAYKRSDQVQIGWLEEN